MADSREARGLPHNNTSLYIDFKKEAKVEKPASDFFLSFDSGPPPVKA